MKFRIAAEDVPAFRRYPLLKSYMTSRARTYQRTCVYFDTPDFQLNRHHVTLQVARAGTGWRQTLTTNHGYGDSRSGREWGVDVTGANLNVSALAQLFEQDPEFMHARFDAPLPSGLIPIFTSTSRRSIWQLDFGHGQAAELSMEHGDVRSAQRQVSVCDLILAHHCGATDAFFEFALTLVRDFKLRLAFQNQADIGYALHDIYTFNAMTAKRIVLMPDINIEEGMRIIIRNCLSQIVGNAAGASIVADLECIHQMRVGLRRLRSAIEIFEPIVPCPERIQTDLAWLSTELGEARDWDILDASTVPSITGCRSDIDDMDVLQKKVHHEAARKHRKVHVALNSTRSARLWVMLKQWASQLGDAPVTATALRDFARENLSRRHKKILKRCDVIEISAPTSRHRVRIACKSLRYATEFFISYYPRKSVNVFLARLTELQDTLGASNDATVAGRLLNTLAEKYPELSGACSYLMGYIAAQDDHRLLEFGRQIRCFSTLKKLAMRNGKRNGKH
ncbi:MAG TPA: CHAD domain-containing protein [Burkholderiaceae bacterium]|nr:CHAD domain-containing protein [Burkholderiaceae bacterium]